MNITGSNDISTLSVKVTFDVSSTNPQVLLENLSTGPDLAACTWWFTVFSPSNTPIHEGEESSPDITGTWLNFTISDQWPRPFGQIEWSGNSYQFTAYVKDGDGNIYSSPVQNAYICRPPGNTKASKTLYGLATCYVQVNCQDANVYFEDTTNHTYKGLDGTIGSSVLRVVYPIDATGTIPDPFVINYFSNALVPITYSSDNYQFLSSSIYDYEFTDEVVVRIKYQSFNPKNGSPAITFAVMCNIDLCPLVCEIDKLRASIESGSCGDVAAAENKLIRINPLLWLVMMGIQQPLCGVDVPALIEQIKTIGGFDCNCCTPATGVIPDHSSIIDGYNFSIVTVCGDISGTVEKTGNNIQFLLQDKKYVFEICQESPGVSTAFTIGAVENDCTKTYCLSVDSTQLAEDILNAIKVDGDLVNLFNSIVNSNPGAFTLVVDGSCIFQSANSYDYEILMANVPADTTFALLTSIKVGGVVHVVNYNFNLTNLAGLQTYLNSLGYGTFAVSESSGNVLIQSTANPNNIQQITYKVSSTVYIASITQEANGFVAISANQVVQNIIDYICALDDSQVVTGAEYTICYIDPDTGDQSTTIVQTGTALTTFITELLARGCDTVTYIKNRPAVTCDDMKTLFPENVLVMQTNDYFFGTKQAICSRVTPVEALTQMLRYGLYDTDAMTAFCAMVVACAGGSPCAPFNSFYVTINDASPSGIDLVVNFSQPDAIKFTIQYARIDNTVTPVFTTIFDVLPGDTPYTISGVDNGQYRVRILPIYADGRACNYTSLDTPACTGITSLSAVYTYPDIIVSYTAIPTVPKVRLTVAYSNGGFFTGIYTNDSADITVTPPVGVYGSYQVTMQPVCDEDTAFYGAATAPVVIEVFNPAVIINNISPGGEENNLITNVTGISGFALSGSMSEGSQQVGVHNAFTGTIAVSVMQTESINNKLTLEVNNGIEVECIDVNTGAAGSQTHTFASGTYVATDLITISYDQGTCEDSPTANYHLNAAYNLSIDDVTGSGVPTLPSTGVNGSESGTQSGMSGNYNITISGTPALTTKLVAYLNGSTVLDCIAVPSAGVYVLAITASSSDDVIISVNIGTC